MAALLIAPGAAIGQRAQRQTATAIPRQSAVATGTCGLAVNASGQARVTINNNCDAKTAAIVQKLLGAEKGRTALIKRQTALIQRQSNDIEALKRQYAEDFDWMKRQVAELGAAVRTTSASAAQPRATPEQRDAATRLAQGDPLAAAAELGRQAAAGGQEVASLYRQQAALLSLRDVSSAFAAIKRAAAIDSDDIETQLTAGDLAVAVGDLPQAQAFLERAREIAEQLAARDPGNSEWQRYLELSHNRLGDVALTRDNDEEARKHYEACFAIAKQLAARDPSNRQWQRDLALSHRKLGKVDLAEVGYIDNEADYNEAQGHLTEARKHFNVYLAISQQLVANDPTNLQWQRDLGVSHHLLGDVARREHRIAVGGPPGLDQVRQESLLAEARKHYLIYLTICEKLAAADPENVEWQRELSVSHHKLGELARDQGDFAEVRNQYEADLAIARRIAARDPENTGWQADLAVSYNRLAKATVDFAEARKSYVAAISIYEQLAARDPTNAQWRHNLNGAREDLTFFEAVRRMPPASELRQSPK